MPLNRRRFLHATAASALFAPVASYGRILGANDRVNIAVAGINGRGKALIRAASDSADGHVRALCDVDSRTFAAAKAFVADKSPYVADVPELRDFRELLELPDLDAVAVATPEHWHMPMAMLAMQAGKHVYLEKPCSFCPGEGELLVEAQAHYGKHIQMGNQQRSAVSSRRAVEAIHGGAIGRTYVGEAWYANARDSIGVAEEVPVPEWLDWELWQGPAPREAYANPWVHYNWHWNRKWGSGEINNNGTHEIDVCRWAMQVDFPVRVQSSGGRFAFDDAWEWFDTQRADYTYADEKLISWTGRSCNPAKTWNRGRGAYIGGTEGYAILDRDGSTLYDMDNAVIEEFREEALGAKLDTSGVGPLDTAHMTNFTNAITRGAELRSPIADARVSQWHCHVGNIAQDLHAVLTIDPTTGHVLDNPEASARWTREYEPGWEPRIV